MKGVQSSRGEYILMADADGATLFSDIEQLEKPLHHAQHHSLLGFRNISSETDSSVTITDSSGRSLLVNARGESCTN